ncbi:MAG: HEAT repeat domain-containing protein [Gemmatimonadota bacterium]|nr:HEAT repeat domain-containing protein [Gemmatimonadota bacterium]
MPNSQELVAKLARAYALTEIVHLRHPSIQEQLDGVSSGLKDHRLMVECRKGSLWANGSRVEAGPEIDDLAEGMQQCGVDFMRLGQGLDARLVGELLDSLRIASISGRHRRLKELAGFHGEELQVVFGEPAGERPALGRSAEAIFAGALAKESHSSEEVEAVPDGGVWDPPGYDSAAPAPGVGGPSEARNLDHPAGDPGSHTGDASAIVEAPADASAEESDAARNDGADAEPMSPDEFRLGVELFMAGSPTKRRSWVGPLEAQAARVDVDANLDAIVDILVTLLGPGDGDEAVAQVARRLVSPGVARALGQRLASAADEEERGEYLQVASGLGELIAPSFAEELATSEDPAARRALVHGLAFLGDAARPSVEDLLSRPEWYVVRNAVSVVALMADKDAQDLLEPCLSHSDARVRQEAVMAIARIGQAGGRSLLPLLADDDPDVRAAAAQAVGTLGVGSATGPLRARLMEEDNDVVLIEVLRALGRLADPDAVEGIRIRATPSFFVRPTKPVRVAGLRALGRIGTQEAVVLLEAGAEDRDPELRSAAQQALEDLA